MKILHINTLDQGGAANACIRLHKGLLNMGMDSKLLVLQQSNNDIAGSTSLYDSNAKRWLKKAQNRIRNNRNYSQVNKLPKGYGRFSFPISAHYIEDHPLVAWADVINLHWVSYLLNYPSFFKKINKPVVWTLHDMHPFSGGYHYEKGFPIEAYQKLIEKNESTKQKALHEKNVHIVAPSKWLHDKSNESPVFSNLGHHNIPYGLDTAIFKPLDQEFSRSVLGIPPDKKVLLFVAESTKDKRKGYDYLLEALEKLSSRDVILATLGSNNGALSNRDNVIELGRIYDERLMAIAYSAADVFVIPSIEDNLPNTVLESICCGTPVVGFTIGGVPDMIKEGKNGFLCPEIEANALAQTLEKALTNNFDTDWIRQDATTRFDQKVQAKTYLNLYQSLLT